MYLAELRATEDDYCQSSPEDEWDSYELPSTQEYIADEYP